MMVILLPYPSYVLPVFAFFPFHNFHGHVISFMSFLQACIFLLFILAQMIPLEVHFISGCVLCMYLT